MNALIDKWHEKDFHERLRILPEELLEWEHLLPEIEQQYIDTQERMNGGRNIQTMGLR